MIIPIGAPATAKAKGMETIPPPRIVEIIAPAVWEESFCGSLSEIRDL